MTTQTPTPDLSFLNGLEPGVAYAALAVTALGMLLFYLGPGIKARLMPPTPPPADPAATSPAAVTGSTPTALPAVMDRADALSDQYIGFLRQQIADRDRELADRDRELERLRMDMDRLRDQLYRRGAP